MRAYVINLARAPDRRFHMEQQLAQAGIDYEFVEAVDGQSVDLTDAAIVAPTWEGHVPFYPNVAGCALSHQAVYKRIVASGDAGAVVLEDDVELTSMLSCIADELSGHLDGARIALLNYHSAQPLRLSEQGGVELPNSGFTALRPVDVTHVGSSGAYFITAHAARLMAELVTPVRVPTDQWGYYLQAEGFHQLCCVYPMPVRKSPFRSTISYYQPHSLRSRLSNYVNRVPYRPLQKALLSRRQRIVDHWARVEIVPEPASMPRSTN